MKRILLIMIGLSSLSMAQENPRFIKADGVVTDNKTTLEWQDDYSGNNGNIKDSNWIDAMAYCEALSLNGKDDWRLPNKNELFSIVDYTPSYPAISSLFENISSYSYWSSTTSSSSTNSAWFVDFYNGYISYLYKSNSMYVRCVRAGQ